MQAKAQYNYYQNYKKILLPKVYKCDDGQVNLNIAKN